MSKAGAVRPRYIAFEMAASTAPSRRAVQNALTGHLRRAGIDDADLPELTRYGFPFAIVRARHDVEPRIRAALPAIDWMVDGGQKVPVRVRTLLTSGTIRTLTQRLGILQERGVRAKR